MKTLITLFAILLFTSCAEKKYNEKAKSDPPKYSFDHILNYNKEDTIFIKSEFDDCGEWGGHEELIKIYRSEKRIKLSYSKFEVDCGIRDSTGSIIQTKKFTQQILLSDSQQSAIMEYINNLMRFKFLDKKISNSGNLFYLSNTKEDLKISHYGNQPLLLNNYNVLLSALELPK